MYNIDDATLSPEHILHHYGKLVQRIVDSAGSTEVSVETGQEVVGVKPLLRFKAEFDVPGVESWSRGGSVFGKRGQAALALRRHGAGIRFGLDGRLLSGVRRGQRAVRKFLETVNTSFSVGDVQI